MKTSGVTLIELLVAAGITSLVLAALGFFVIRVFRLPPTYVEQGSITNEAQTEMERMSDILRSARVDSGGAWVAGQANCALTVESDINNDDVAETVRYVLNPASDQLSRSVNGGQAQVLAQGLQNDCTTSESLFAYYSLGGGQAVRLNPDELERDEVDRVVIKMIVDADPDQLPGEATFQTVVTPREGDNE